MSEITEDEDIFTLRQKVLNPTDEDINEMLQQANDAEIIMSKLTTNQVKTIAHLLVYRNAETAKLLRDELNYYTDMGSLI